MMWHIRRMCILTTAICWYATVACSFLVPKPAYPEPPSTSYRATHFTVSGAGPPQRVQGAAVTPDFFSATKAQPLLGRLFAPEEYLGAAQFVLLSHQFWQREFGGNPAVIGMKIEVDGQIVTVIGVMPKSFDLPPGAELWIPQASPGR